jgi:glycosyltransferase involved in cell wall biosynthesis
MKILMLNWMDLKNPKAGGAEVLTEGILRELAHQGHQVTLFCDHFEGANREEIVDGYTVIRRGYYWSVQLLAPFFWFSRFKKENFDIVIDQIHSLPFLTPLYVPRHKRFAFIHEVAKDIWFTMFPFPFSYIGYATEYLLLQLYRTTRFITVSDSTKGDLISIGIPHKNIAITPEAIIMPDPILMEKSAVPTIIFIGRLTQMKRVEDFLDMAALVKKVLPNLQTWIVGPGEEQYVESLKAKNEALGLGATFFGRANDKEKYILLAQAHVLASCSVKEGYGLVIIEAGTMATPSVTYNVAGFRDAIIDGTTGLLSQKNTPESLALAVLKLLEDKALCAKLADQAKAHSQQFTFPNAAKAFEKILVS